MGELISLKKMFHFEAAHFLPHVPQGHKCRRMHGHSFQFEIEVRGQIDPKTGWVIDFGDMSKVVKPLIHQYLDHYLLNDVDGLENPTSENLCLWLWKKIKPDLPSLYKISVKETCNTRAEYRGPEK
jgi:6-pyruvoyltetrahydropterin/6-carboxytetrahydropterin synthase